MWEPAVGRCSRSAGARGRALVGGTALEGGAGRGASRQGRAPDQSGGVSVVLSRRMPSTVTTADSDVRSACGWGVEVAARFPEEVTVFPWFEAEFEAVTAK